MNYHYKPAFHMYIWASLGMATLNTALAQAPKAKAQLKTTIEVSDTAYFDLSRDITEQMVPFEEIYQAALHYSPILKVQDAVANSRLEAYRYSRLNGLETIYPFLNYSQGNQTLIATGTNPSDGLQLSNGTRWGVNVQLPLSTIFGRRNLIQQAKSDYQVTQAQKGVIALQLKRDLIVVYQNLLVSQRNMNSRLRDEQVALTAFRVSEVELQQGKIDPAQLAVISNNYAQSKSYAERARGDFMINFYDLEALVGVPLQSLLLK